MKLTPRIALTLTALASVTGAANADTLYGSTATELYSINTANNSQILIFATGLSNINGLAYDAVRNSLYYRSGSSNTGQGDGAFYRYDLGGGGQTLVTAATIFTNNPGQSIGAATNASFYNGNYWFIGQGGDLLVRFNPVTLAVSTFGNFDATATTFSFNGDIAINRNGVLYGSSADRFWSVDIATGSPTGYASIVNAASDQTNAVNRQLALPPTAQRCSATKAWAERGNGQASTRRPARQRMLPRRPTFVPTLTWRARRLCRSREPVRCRYSASPGLDGAFYVAARSRQQARDENDAPRRTRGVVFFAPARISCGTIGA